MQVAVDEHAACGTLWCIYHAALGETVTWAEHIWFTYGKPPINPAHSKEQKYCDQKYAVSVECWTWDATKS